MGSGRGVVDGSPPKVFDMLQYFEKILPSVEKRDILDEMRYIFWVVALL